MAFDSRNSFSVPAAPRPSEEDGVSWLNSDMAHFIPVIEVQYDVSCMCLTPTNDLCIGTAKGAILVYIPPPPIALAHALSPHPPSPPSQILRALRLQGKT